MSRTFAWSAESNAIGWSSLMRSTPTLALNPTRAPPSSNVGVPDEQDRDEEQHLDQRQESQPVERHRPRVKKDDFDVEQDEQHGDQVELDREALAGVAHRRDAHS
jgi:hypothetical protein